MHTIHEHNIQGCNRGEELRRMSITRLNRHCRQNKIETTCNIETWQQSWHTILSLLVIILNISNIALRMQWSTKQGNDASVADIDKWLELYNKQQPFAQICLFAQSEGKSKQLPWQLMHAVSETCSFPDGQSQQQPCFPLVLTLKSCRCLMGGMPADTEMTKCSEKEETEPDQAVLDPEQILISKNSGHTLLWYGWATHVETQRASFRQAGNVSCDWKISVYWINTKVYW